MGAPRRVKKLSSQLISMDYFHAANGQPYRHDFVDDDVVVWCMSDGSVQIVSARGRRLWDEFTVSDSE